MIFDCGVFSLLTSDFEVVDGSQDFPAPSPVFDDFSYFLFLWISHLQPEES